MITDKNNKIIKEGDLIQWTKNTTGLHKFDNFKAQVLYAKKYGLYTSSPFTPQAIRIINTDNCKQVEIL